MHSMNISLEILHRTTACLTDFSLDFETRVAVALSGGKDSTTLMLVLRELVYDVVPMIVDLGYRDFAASEIAMHATKLGFEPVILAQNNEGRISRTATRLKRNLAVLHSDQAPSPPCGLCSATK